MDVSISDLLVRPRSNTCTEIRRVKHPGYSGLKRSSTCVNRRLPFQVPSKLYHSVDSSSKLRSKASFTPKKSRSLLSFGSMMAKLVGFGHVLQMNSKRRESFRYYDMDGKYTPTRSLVPLNTDKAPVLRNSEITPKSCLSLLSFHGEITPPMSPLSSPASEEMYRPNEGFDDELIYSVFFFDIFWMFCRVHGTHVWSTGKSVW